MDTLIADICAYLEYLRHNCGLKLSVHFDRHAFDRLPEPVVRALLPYNAHTGAYCTVIKRTDHGKCLQHQRSLLLQCRSRSGFCQTCHAGVYEYIHPIFKCSEAIGFAAVSGYRQLQPPENNNRSLWEETLNADDIPLALCRAVIPPLCLMLEQLFTAHSTTPEEESARIMLFLNEYHADITLTDLSEYFNRSKSHISHSFKSKYGMSIRAYCNDRKLEDAKTLLCNTDVPITEVAFDAGFHDVSYFISLFRRKFGISPLQYRKNHRNLK